MNYYIDAFKNYFKFSGRARRKEYWMFVLFNFIVSLVLGIIGKVTGITILSTIYGIAVIIPSLALCFRRLHDTGRNGAWILLSLIPFIGEIVLFIFFCLDSQSGENKYGPNPKGV
ncbi:MAG: DUF805 domain-containing protein [Lachnospiraceae bacterium]|nr:DUF805 domain-containing protein [Lachnospiraceae bacterium]